MDLCQSYIHVWKNIIIICLAKIVNYAIETKFQFKCGKVTKNKLFFFKKTIDNDGNIKYQSIVRNISHIGYILLTGKMNKYNDEYILMTDKNHGLRLISIQQYIENDDKIDFKILNPDLIKCTINSKILYLADGIKISYRSCKDLSLSYTIKTNNINKHHARLQPRTPAVYLPCANRMDL